MVYVFSRKRWKLLVRYQEAIRYRAYTIRRELFEVPLSSLPREVLAPSTLCLPRVWHSTYIEFKGYKSRFFSHSSWKQINPLHVLGTTDHFRKVAYFSTAEDVALDLNIQNHVIMSLTWHPYMNLFLQVELSTSTSTERYNILVSSESSSCTKCLIDFYLSSKK